MQFLSVRHQVGISDELSSGTVVTSTDIFIYLHHEHDFHFDGYCIAPVTYITEPYGNGRRFNDFYESMLRKEKLIEETMVHPQLDLRSWQTIFADLKKAKTPVIVEGVVADEEFFTLGYLHSIGKTQCKVLHVDALGYKLREPMTISYKHIQQLRFGEKYVNTYVKYSREPKTKAK